MKDDEGMAVHSASNESGLPPPLPLRAPPSANEDLLSMLRRCASRMGYPDVRWLLRPTEGNWFLEETDVSLLSAKRDYRVLGRLLLLSQEELHSHTLHRFAPLLENSESFQQPPEQDSASTHLPQLSPRSREAHFLPIRSIRVCPVCLREPDCYDRLYWRMQLIFYCPQHRVRLLEKCPSCGTPIAASRPSPHSCPRCQHGDYRASDSAPLSFENPLYLGERLFLEALGIELPTDETAARPLASSPLSTLSGISYLSLLKAVTARLEALFSDRELFLLVQMLCALPAEDSTQLQDLLLGKKAAVFLLFHWLFLAWPVNFSTFLDAWYSLSTPPFTGKQPESMLSSSFLLFYEQLDPDSYAWLRRAYLEFHRHFRYDPARIDDFRATLNTLAQSIHLQKTQAENVSGTPGEDKWLVYVPPRSLTPIVPYPWESLGSALSRAARKMDHPMPERLLYYPLFTPISLCDFSEGEVRLPGEAGNTMLAHLLQIPKEDIPHLTGLSLIASLGLPPYNITRYWARPNEPDVQSWFRPNPTRKTRVCPYCLGEQQGYDRVYWSLRGILSCPRHKVRLLEKCPVCLKDIPAVRPQVRQCPHCKGETYALPTRQLPEESMLIIGTSLLLTMLQMPSSEASEAFKLLAPSPLLTMAPPIYFALLVELTEELGSYRSYSQQLLQMCRVLGESTLTSEQAEADPYGVDAEVLLFHLIFVRWPENFFRFLDFLYDTVRFPSRSPDYIQDRWIRLLRWSWRFIVPDWLLHAFDEHEYRHRVLKDEDT